MLLDLVLIGFGRLVKQRLLMGLIEALKETSVNEILELYNVDNIRLTIAKPSGLRSEEIEFLKANIDDKISIQSVDVADKSSLESINKRLTESKFSIVYIAAPNYTHAGYIDLFIDNANRIFVEKPICNTSKEIATLLSKHPREAFNKVRMVDHYLYKPPIYELIYNFHHYYELSGELEELEFKILIDKPYEENRQWLYLSGVIRDLFTHNLSLVFKLNELYPKIVPLGNLKIQSVKKGLYDTNGLNYDIKYDKEKLKETYANIKLKIGELTIKSEVGVGVDKVEKSILIKGEKGRLKLNLLDNTIKLLNSEQKVLFEVKNPPSEYKKLMKEIITGERKVGLSFDQAKLEVEIFDMLDNYNSMKKYKIGTKPKSILGL